MTRFLLGCVLGTSIGTLAHALTWPDPPPPPPPPGIPFDPVRWVRGPCPPPPPTPTQDPDTAEDAEHLTRTLHAIAATREALELAIGTPVPFEGPVPDQASIQARVAEAMPEQQVLWTSCEEAPCIVVLESDELATNVSALGSPRYIATFHGEKHHTLIAWEWDRSNAKRLDFRMRLELEALQFPPWRPQ